MPSLKDLKNRIKSVKNTQKITKAMKMVAAAKLRRAKEQAEAARPYAEAMEQMVASLAASQRNEEMKNGGNEEKDNSSILQFLNSSHPLLSGNGKDQVHLVIVATASRGLCGGFNSSIVRAARRKIRERQAAGKTVKILCVGRKGYEQLALEFKNQIIGREDIKGKKLAYSDADAITTLLIEKFEAGEFDVAHIVYNKFKSAISQIVTWQQLIPLAVSSAQFAEKAIGSADRQLPTTNSPYDYEPSEEEILADLLPKNVGIQIYRALLENAASEQGARMSAMDNATRNAGDMIKKLNLKYNRTRQAAITKELIEIISGAEAV
jgi:F-type H+-transporting ATPase subunit gamma